MTKDSISTAGIAGLFLVALGIAAALTAFFVAPAEWRSWLFGWWRGWGELLIGLLMVAEALHRRRKLVSPLPTDKTNYRVSLGIGTYFAVVGIVHLI